MAEPYLTLRKQYFTACKRNFTARVSALPRQLFLHKLAHKLHALVYVFERRAGEVQPERALVPFGLRIEVYAGDVGYLFSSVARGTRLSMSSPLHSPHTNKPPSGRV